MTVPQAPVRLCCMQRHYGMVCADGTVMCCICFGKCAVEDLVDYGNGSKIDVCKPCKATEDKRSGVVT